MVALDAFEIVGPCRLRGEVAVEGAKNFALPAVAAALLTDAPVHLTNIPKVQDLFTLIRLLEGLGATAEWETGALRLCTRGVERQDPPYDLVRRMRASVLPWRVSGGPASPSPAGAPSASGPWTCTSTA